MHRLLPCFILMIGLVSACGDDDDRDFNMGNQDFGMEISSLNYLALGDSYTIGTSVAASDRWSRQLVNRLSGTGVLTSDQDSINIDIVAVNGWTTTDLRQGIAARNDLLDQYDLVSLLIGVNNQFQGRGLEEYRTEFADLLEGAIDRAGGDKSRVFVVSIPDYAFTPFGSGSANITAGVNEFNAAAKTVTEATGVDFYNITDISRDGLREPELVASDGLHPSGKQYGRWVDEVLFAPIVEKIQP